LKALRKVADVAGKVLKVLRKVADVAGKVLKVLQKAADIAGKVLKILECRFSVNPVNYVNYVPISNF
jgi:hypothetical protein